MFNALLVAILALTEISISAPMKYRVSDLREPLFITLAENYSGTGSAVEIVGDLSPDSEDGYLPRIELNCGFRAAGIRLSRLDNVILDSVSVSRSAGTAIEIVSCRQSHFRTIQASKCIGAEPVILMRSARTDQGDANNHCRFDFLSVRNCGNPVYLSLVGGGKATGMDRIHDITFGQVFLHCPWEAAASTIPASIQPEFAQKSRTILQVENAKTIKFDHLAVRSDPSITDGACVRLRSVETSEFRGITRANPARKQMDGLDLNSVLWQMEKR